MKAKNPAKKDRRFLIPDTNILWHEQKDVPVAPDFMAFDQEFRIPHNLRIIIPETVLGELMYQHTSSGVDALGKLNKQIKALAAIAASDYAHRISEDHVRRDVRKKLMQWVSDCGADVATTPIDSIDWRRVVTDSLWRVPPFTEDKKAKSEKGFRDSVILETVIHLASINKLTQYDFVTGDSVLREATRARSKGLSLNIFESLSDYSSHLRLLDQKLTDNFVSAISSRAREKFMSRNDKPDIWKSEGIPRIIKDRFSDKLAPPPSSPAGHSESPFLKLFPNRSAYWKPESAETIWVTKPSFQERHGANIYLWNSRVHVIQFFRNIGPASGSLLTEIVSENQLNIRRISFDVSWRAVVGTDGRFSKCMLDGLSYVETVFRAPTSDEYQVYAPTEMKLGDVVP